MERELERSGQINDPVQGFIVHWDRTGLQIQVTDYHAGLLRLPWQHILSLARIARTEQGKADH